MILWLPPERAPRGELRRDQLWPKEWAELPFTIDRGYSIPSDIRAAISDGATFVAHNASNFDALAWDYLVGGQQPKWIDTVHFCRAASLPGALHAASMATGGKGKQPDGKRLIDLLTRAKVKQGEAVYPVGTIQLWESFLRYNIADVLALADLYEQVSCYGEPDVIALDARINSRGCPVDMVWAAQLRRLWAELQAEAKGKIAELTEQELTDDDARSPTKVKAWLAARGCVVESLNRASLAALMSDPDGFFGDSEDENAALCAELLKQRSIAARSTVGKVERLYTVVDVDSRVRGMLVYHGAHTGRFSGRALQPHNMPRGVKCDMASLLAKRERLTLADVRAAAPKACPADVLATMFRPVICAEEGKALAICDYSKVEAVGVAWLAGEQNALGAFADPKRDIYTETATPLGTTRDVGKVIVLGCGYGMGAPKFAASCRLQGVNLDALGLTADQCVNSYRKQFPRIAQFWKEVNRAAERCVVEGFCSQVGRVSFQRRGAHMAIVLPSGRAILYRNVAWTRGLVCWNGKSWYANQLECDDPRGFRRKLYGGLLVENITQGACRDLLVDALLRIDPLYETVLHVHDEGVWQVDAASAEQDLHTIAGMMSTAPAWAAGFPLRVEGFVGKHYTKARLPGAPHADYMGGENLG